MNFKRSDRPYLIAEIGGNHEGNFDYAVKLTELACSTDVDAVKFQIYTGASLVNPVVDENRYKHFKKFEILYEKYLLLKDICLEKDKEFIISPWDIESLEFFNDSVNCYKIGSGDLTAHSVIERIAKKLKPIILSTGLSTMEEVEAAVEFIQSRDPFYRKRENLSVLQCSSMYPIPYSDANLSVIGQYSNLGVIPGYSDHTVGTKALELASVLGAEILEFHFSDDNKKEGFRDHKVSLTPGDVAELITTIKKNSEFLGCPIKRPVMSEIENGHLVSFRRAVFPSRDLEKGHIVNEEDLMVLRPCEGIPADRYYDLIGKKTNRPLRKGEILNWELFEDVL